MAKANAPEHPPTTTVRGVRITDDDWEWLGEWAVGAGLDRASVLRRLITLLRHDFIVQTAVPQVTDHIAGRRNANLRQNTSRSHA